MKNSILITALLFISISLKAQDTIQRTNGMQLITNIVGIENNVVTYTFYDQPEGRALQLSTSQILKIKLADGTYETYNNVKITTESESDSEVMVIRRRGRDKRIDPNAWTDNQILKSGFFINGILGGYSSPMDRVYNTHHYENGSLVATPTSQYDQGLAIGIGIQVGGTMYFGESDKYRAGINLFGRFDFYAMDWIAPVLTPVNVGISNIWKISDTKAIEANLNFGYTIDFNRPNAYSINPEIKLRLKKFTCGIGYSLEMRDPNAYDDQDPNLYLAGHRFHLILGWR